MRKVRFRLRRDVRVEVRLPPCDRDAEPRRRERVARVDASQDVLELLLCVAQVGDILELRGDNRAVQGRDDDLDALAVRRGEVEQMLLGGHSGGLHRRTRRCGSELIDELVDSAAAECGGCSAAEEPTPCEPHQRAGSTSTRLCSRCCRFFLTRVALSYGLITCWLSVYSDPL